MSDVGVTRRVAFGLGANVGDRLHYLQLAVNGIVAHPDIELVGVSQVYETVPVGGPHQSDFLNAVVVADSALALADLLALAQRCEKEAGRVRRERWGPRTLDVDLLAVGDERSDDSRLTLPHPRIGERAFVLAPWADVDPEFVVRDDTTVRDLLDRIDITGIRESDEKLQVAA